MNIFKKLRQTLAMFLACGVACSLIGGCAEVKTESKTEYLELPSAPNYEKVDENVLKTEYKTFYFDGANGDDENSGLNENEPKRSLSEVTDIIANYGARYPLRILLKR